MSDSNEATASTSTADSSGTQRPRGVNYEALKHHIVTHKIDCGLWAIRVLAIILGFAYFIPIFGNSHNFYYKVLLANAAINALRLHQRVGRVTLSREFISALLTEDSCHYLFYSLIFLYVAPLSLVLVPILLFCMLHAASYSLTLLDTLGQNSWWGARLLISLVEFQSLNILRAVAFTEICLMPFTVVLILMGRATLLTPFIYYHFLVQRYNSRRNPYTRNMFRELRMLSESTASKPNMPSFIRTIILSIVKFTCKLAPMPLQTPPQQ
ncbi:transmembrane protein 33-containing Krueppel homolog 2 [Leptinotarsa decemlineata]|uniref:transmembrane protein 33-containing Krueppel homolog 2 n=1 Tax=Leptinotarsa decemlineata TaxID=7539 RepID=UPI000C254120|nr:Krueppel homolog 2 [Leptinotarsa decemlineata]